MPSSYLCHFWEVLKGVSVYGLEAIFTFFIYSPFFLCAGADNCNLLKQLGILLTLSAPTPFETSRHLTSVSEHEGGGPGNAFADLRGKPHAKTFQPPNYTILVEIFADELFCMQPIT